MCRDMLIMGQGWLCVAFLFGCMASSQHSAWVVSTINWHLPRSLPVTKQQGHLPSASAEVEPCAAAAVDLQLPLREFRAEWGTLCSRNLMGQVFRWLDAVRNWFHDYSPSVQFSSVAQCADSSAASWTAARQASLSITSSQSLLKLMSIELVMPSNHLTLCHPFLLLPSNSPSIRVFFNELPLCSKWRKCWSFSFNISPSSEYSGLISFRIDWFDLLAAQGTPPSRVFSNTTVQKHQFFGAQLSLWSNSHMHTWLLEKP